MEGSRFVSRSGAGDVTGAIVVVDVIRAFTTAAAAFAAGAREIHLVAGVEEALALRDRLDDPVVIGEDHGHRPDGFDLANSPVMAAAFDMVGRIVVQRTSAGTQGVFAAPRAQRMWCTGLVTASATARALRATGLGEPTYVITGRFPDAPGDSGVDDLLTAKFIDALVRGRQGDPAGRHRDVRRHRQVRLRDGGRSHPDRSSFTSRAMR